MTKFTKYLALFAIVLLVFTACDASAGNFFSIVTGRMIDTFKNVRSVIFIIGGFGLVGLGFAAIFGKVQWKWLAALAAGLAIVAVAGLAVDYVTRQGQQTAVDVIASSTFGDTLR